MSAPLEFDTAIVGAGIAGLTAGVRLAEVGIRVAVLEKGEGERYPCNTRMTGGAFHVAFHDVNDDAAVLLDAINHRTRGFARAEIAQAVAGNVGHAVQWLKTKGVRFIKVGQDAHRKHTLAPPISLKPGLYWEGRAGDVLLRTLGGVLKQAGGVLLRGARGRRLILRDGRCSGVEAEFRGERSIVQAGSVVICDGGFQANPALLREFVTPAPEKLKQRGAASGDGDGLQMAREVGAQLVGMENVYGHLLCRDAMHNDDLWPFPILDFVCAAGIVIDDSARRFADEGAGGVYLTNRIARLLDPLSATVIFDHAIWEDPGRHFIAPANPLLTSWGGTIFRANDLGSLAQQIGLPQGALEETVSQYNAALQMGRAERLDPPRTTSVYRAWPIHEKPFYAVRLCAGITYTMGGIAIDGASRVIGPGDQPIPGLYAAGCASGGLEGGEFVGYVGGLSKSVVTAFRAANHIAAKHQDAMQLGAVHD